MAPPQRRRHKEERQPVAPLPPAPPSAFAAAVSKVAVTQICLSAGYSAAEPSALHALADVAARYLEALGRSAASVAAAHGRTDSNLLDIVRAIEDLGATRGFAGAADAAGPPMRSGALRELMAFVESVEEVPFPKPIRRGGDQKGEGSHSTSFAAAGREPPVRHMPQWLPRFPDGPWESEGEGKMKGTVEEEERAADNDEGGEGKKMVELPAERGRVRFRMGATAATERKRLRGV